MVFSEKDSWVEKRLRKMTLSEKVGQMIVASIEGSFRGSNDTEFVKLCRLSAEGKIGGVMFLKGDALGAGILANNFQARSTIPLLMSADMERGLAMRLAGATEFPPGMAIAATRDTLLASRMAEVIAAESHAVGIHHSYIPTVDLNINPSNPVIGTRSFGDNIDLTIAMSAAVIEGLQSRGIVATAKHFPGHGDVTVDSHLALPVLTGDRARLEQYELKPFRAAIQQGVLSVMVGHLAVPKLTGTMDPASLSPVIVTGLLREELGFRGVIITDAMNMKALYNGQNVEEISIRAVQAGNDILLFPPDPEVAHRALENAVVAGIIPEKRIDESVRRVLRLKRWLGLDMKKNTDLSRLSEQISRPESLALADMITEKAVTTVRDRNRILPLHNPGAGTVLNLMLKDRKGAAPEKSFTESLADSYQVTELMLDPACSPETLQKAVTMTGKASAVIVTVRTGVIPVSAPGGYSEQQITFLRNLPSLVVPGTPLIIISFGSPYVLDAFQEIGTALCTYTWNTRAEMALVRVIRGEIEAKGNLPVSLSTSGHP